MSFPVRRVLLLGLILVDLFLQFYSKAVGWGTSNAGFSFGLGEGKLPLFFYLGLTGVIFVLLVGKKLAGAGWWLMLAGGFSNSLARILAGFVWDYLHWNFLFSLWFNLADVSITLGVGLCFYELLKQDGQT